MGALLTQFMNRYAYTDFHELNADWMIRTMMELINQVENFVSLNAIKYADPIQWNITSQYEKNTVVIDPLSGTAYISVKPVPMGVALTNTDYWTVVFDLGSFVVRAAKNFSNRYEADTTTTATFASSEGDWLVWGDTLYEVIVPTINAGDQYVVDSNIRHITVEEVADALAQAIDNLDAKVGDLDDLTTSIKTSVVDAINSVMDEIGDISTLNVGSTTNLVDAIQYVNDSVDNLYIHDVTINVPGDHATVNDAIGYLRQFILGDNITIKVADGTYSGNMLNLINDDFKGVSIIGNTTDPEMCTINLSSNEIAFYLNRSNLKLIDGFKVVTSERNANDTWNGHPIGVFAHYYSNVNVGVSMLFDTCYYAIQAANGSQITMAKGETLTSAICSALTISNVFGQRKGKNIVAINSGDVAYFTYNGAHIYSDAAIAMNSLDASLNLGYGFLSEHSSAIRAFNCFCSNCRAGIGASDASSLIAHNSSFLWNNVFGAECKENSAMEIIGCDPYNNSSYGILAQNNSFILCRGVNPHAGGSGFAAVFGSFIHCDQDCTCNLVTGYGFYYDHSSFIGDRSHMLGTTTGQVLERGLTMFDDHIPTTGNWTKGDIIYNNEPSNGVFAWECITSGVPGTWKTVLFSGQIRFGFVRPGTPVNGDTIFDTSRHKLTTYYNGLWIDATHKLNTFYNNDIVAAGSIYFDDPNHVIKVYDGSRWRYESNHGATGARPTTNLVIGEFFFDTTLNKPIWYNGSGWVDATGATV